MLVRVGRLMGRGGAGYVAAPRIQLSGRTIAEDAEVGDPIGTLSVANGSGSYSFAIDSDPSGLFAIDGSSLEVDDTLTPGSYPITISASGGDVAVSPREFTIEVTEVADPPDPSSYVPTYYYLGF